MKKRFAMVTCTASLALAALASGCSADATGAGNVEETGETSSASTTGWGRKIVSCSQSGWESNQYVRNLLSELCSGSSTPGIPNTSWNAMIFSNNNQINVNGKTDRIGAFFYGSIGGSNTFFMPVIKISSGPDWYIINAGSQALRDNLVSKYSGWNPVYASTLTSAECWDVNNNSNFKNHLSRAHANSAYDDVDVYPAVDSSCSTLLKYDPWVLTYYSCGYFC